MAIVFEQPPSNAALARNFAADVLPTLRIAKAGALNFAFYYRVHQGWRWVGILNGDGLEPCGFADSETSVQAQIVERYRTLLAATELRDASSPARKAVPRVRQRHQERMAKRQIRHINGATLDLPLQSRTSVTA